MQCVRPNSVPVRTDAFAKGQRTRRSDPPHAHAEPRVRLRSASTTRGLRDHATPALALTLPILPTEQDDGLLTASEVTQLKLNADFVVLSACNT